MRGGVFEAGGGGQQPQEQFQRIRADIKNILPIDLYEGMLRAGKLVTNLYQNISGADERKIKEFCEVFWTTFNFTRMKLNKNLVSRIDEWFSEMTIPPKVDNRPGAKKNTYLFRGIDLFNEFYNELVLLGIGSMFDEPITPPIGIIAELENEDIWAGLPDE